MEIFFVNVSGADKLRLPRGFFVDRVEVETFYVDDAVPMSTRGTSNGSMRDLSMANTMAAETSWVTGRRKGVVLLLVKNSRCRPYRL